MKTGITNIGNQIIDLLERLDDQDFQQQLDVFNGSTLGQHFRHILEFYENLSAADLNPVIDYSQRERNPLLESNTGFATEVLKKYIFKISMMDENQPVVVKGDYSNVNIYERPLLQSTIGREMMFVHDHAVHHLAMIKVGIKFGFPDISINEDLGLAPSTIRYRSGN